MVVNTPVFAAEYRVSPGGSIQDAIDAAKSGDTIIVEAGTYEEYLGIGPDKNNITLQAEDGVVLQNPDGDYGGPGGIVLYDGVHGVTVEGFELQGYHAGIVLHYLTAPLSIPPVYGREPFNNTIQDNTINNGYWGIILNNAKSNLIVNNGISECSVAGIAIWNSMKNQVESNEIMDCGNGIGVRDSNDNTVTNNTLTRCINGIGLANSDNNQLVNNEIDEMQYFGIGSFSPPPGVREVSSSNNIIQGNIITNIEPNNPDHRGAAIKLVGNGNEVTENSISNSNQGIRVTGNYTNITGNTINGFVEGSGIEGMNEEGINIEGIGNTIKENLVLGYQVAPQNADGKSILVMGLNNNVLANTISDADIGIEIRNSDDNLIQDNIVSKCNKTGIRISGNRNDIIVNTVTDSGMCIEIHNSIESTIADNVLDHSVGGIAIWEDADNNLFSNNTISDVLHGIGITGNDNVIESNRITNVTHTAIAIWGQSATNNLITENTISNNEIGINVGGSNNVISGNKFERSTEFGINTFGLASGNLIGSNHVSDIQGTGIFIGGTNQDVQENHVANCQWGIAVGSDSSNIVRNTVDNCTDQGIGIWTNLDIWGLPEHNLIDENNISRCRVGIGSGGSSNTINNNKIKNITLHGISIWPGSNFNTIDGNLISHVDNETDNGIGISILGDNNTIQNNSVFYCDMYGVAAYPIADDNIIQGNTVLHNGIYDLYAYIPENNVWINNIFDTKSW